MCAGGLCGDVVSVTERAFVRSGVVASCEFVCVGGCVESLLGGACFVAFAIAPCLALVFIAVAWHAGRLFWYEDFACDGFVFVVEVPTDGPAGVVNVAYGFVEPPPGGNVVSCEALSACPSSCAISAAVSSRLLGKSRA